MKINYLDSSAEELAKTIDNINIEFQKFVQENKVNTLYTRSIMNKGYSAVCDLRDSPFECIMWNRSYGDDFITRPAQKNSYKLYFVHGHDSDDDTTNNIYNLDNWLGKSEKANKGIYTVLYSTNEHVLSLKFEEPAILENMPEIETKEAVKETKIVDSKLGKKYSPKETVLTQDQSNACFLKQLKLIEDKEKYLRNRGYLKAADCAAKLHESVHNYYQSFLNSELTGDDFKSKCLEAIKDARPELETHRGMKQVLGNLALAVVGLGVFYVIAGLINKAMTGKFLFFKTDSANKVDSLEESLGSVKKT